MRGAAGLEVLRHPKAGIAGKKDGQELLRTGVALPADYQRRRAAENGYGVLLCLQALDGGGTP